jgi:hypothetical protein
MLRRKLVLGPHFDAEFDPSRLEPAVVETRHPTQATMDWWIVGALTKVGVEHDGDQLEEHARGTKPADAQYDLRAHVHAGIRLRVEG